MRRRDAVGSAARELLGRYREVLRAAWAARRELAGPARLADEAAFLPAALALRDTPMHPAPRRTAAALIVLAGIALAWAIVGRVDIVAVAGGKLVVSDRAKLVQPLERAVVRQVRVRDGDRVEAGATLIELDATTPSADRDALDGQWREALSQHWRTATLIAALETGREPAPGPLPAAWTVADRRQAREALDAEWSEWRARAARLEAEAARRQAEHDTASAAVDRLETALPQATRREEDLRDLQREGFAATHAWQDRRRERLDVEGELRTQHARLREALAALAETRASRAALAAETRRRWHEAREQAQARLAQIDAELRKTDRREQLTRLVAPVTGTVQQLAVHTGGGVVTEAQALMVVVPDDAPVTAEVMLENKDVGFVRVGDTAAIKLEAFPFTRHGTLPATVTRVSADAIDDEQRGPLYAVTLTLDARDIEVDGQRRPLRPGMALGAEIRTGDRRVIDFLLSPLERRANESLRER
ncbi:HlyD family type I secretion periplasmic adaptor subunit [Mitsuaria sp. GD03876]|uniref:HlyD family type I secretion periplasmic adaptor subunit n=1 Tax=Mitsuaria sp. GD03876 TaxID=2975399 RepID=UPI0024472EE1|nr:HlyD family type I secretion periplasmic adaptor subunit [Mitsuaria sp. GD03876]MDH0867314.1 HlyD family type I secretion periplasmic adaptor subunit [Mitsuaria sp. GD03876]